MVIYTAISGRPFLNIYVKLSFMYIEIKYTILKNALTSESWAEADNTVVDLCPILATDSQTFIPRV